LNEQYEVKADDVLSRGALERVVIIRQIFEILLASTSPGDFRANPYWYNDTFDSLYEKDITHLRMTLTVLRKSRGKNHI
jgi:hypothetical protein